MWNAVQCAVQGTSHIKFDVPCQDRTCYKCQNGVSVVSLADGAGSCSLSHLGAESVTQNLCSNMVNNFDNYFRNSDGVEVKKEILKLVTEELEKVSKEQNCSIKLLSSTLLFVAVKNDLFILGHIGDGVIGYLKGDELKIASGPMNGDFVNTTVFTTSSSALLSMNLIKGNLNDINSFILMSDGAESVFYDKINKKLAVGLKKIIFVSRMLSQEYVETKIKHFFENTVRKFTQDDCSLICLSNISNFSFLSLSDTNKRSLLKISTSVSKRVYRRYLYILELLSKNSLTCNELAKLVYLKPKYLLSKLLKLANLGLIEKNGDLYSLCILNYDDNKKTM